MLDTIAQYNPQPNPKIIDSLRSHVALLKDALSPVDIRKVMSSD